MQQSAFSAVGFVYTEMGIFYLPAEIQRSNVNEP